MSMTLPLYSLVYIGDVSGAGGTDGFITEHNRDHATVSTEIIQNKKRTVTGTMRTYVVARKRTFDFSWHDVPGDAAHTFDGLKGGADIITFYEAYYDKEFYLYLFNRNKVVKTGSLSTDLSNNTANRYLVRFNDFSYQVNKRGAKFEKTVSAYTDLWDISLSMEEV